MLRLPPPADDATRAFARDLGISVTVADVLVRRGHGNPSAARDFLEPRLARLSSPEGMQDRREAILRLARAARAHERVCVFGDYDADGITSAALMTEVLQALGADVIPCLADRTEGGYGVSDPAMARILAHAPGLVVTCDCGSGDHDRLMLARKRGVDVVVIDHHLVPDAPLPVLAYLNPHRPDCAYPYKGLASVGLALTLAAGVRAELGADLDIRRWLDLVALGTIADVAPLDGDNRALVRAGLGVLSQATRPAIAALATVTQTRGPLTGEDVAFRYAPRINAPGRIGDPNLALRLLLARSAGEAAPLAEEIHDVCERRKLLDRAILAEALEMLADPALARLPAIVLGKPGWHPGVVGIVAGRLVARFGKPTVVIGFDGPTGRGSARAPEGFPLYDALSLAREAMIGFGGHQAAAGVHVELSKLGTLRDLFAGACERFPLPDCASLTHPVAEVRLAPEDTLADVVRDCARFEPCGHGNRAPRIVLERARVRRARPVGQGHLRLDLDSTFGPLRGFGIDLAAAAPAVGSVVHVTGKLRNDTYGGAGAVEIFVEAITDADAGEES